MKFVQRVVSSRFGLAAALTFCLITTCLPSTVLGQKVVADVSSKSVYLGQPFDYQIRVSDVQDAELEPFASDDFTAQLRGQSAIQSSMGGRRRSSITTVFTYSLTARKTGTFVIPAPVVKVSGAEVRGEEITIQVVGPSESKLFTMIGRVVPPRVYPMQAFTVELEINLRALDKPFAVASPVSSRILVGPPRLKLPWFDDSLVPEGIEEVETLDLRKLQTGDGSGFNINGMRRFELLTFLPDEEKFKPDKPADEDDAREWFRYKFKRRFYAERDGTFTFGRATLQGRLVSKIEDVKATRTPVFGVSDPITVEIMPVPLEDRPESWCGVIGDLDVQSSITPKDARVGQPLTLTLALTGTGSLNDAFSPDLTKIDEVNQKFRVYDSTSKPTDDGRTFTYSLRAKEAGDIVFPPIELAWFNPLQEKFVTGRTSAIPLTIAKSEVLVPENIVASQRQVQTTALQATANGLAANLPTLDVQQIRPHSWFAAWGGIAVLTAVTLLLTGREASAKSKQKTRLKQQLAAAEAKLADGTKNLAANDMSGIAAVRESINGIVSAVSDSEAEGMTTEEAISQLKTAGFESELIRQTDDLLQVCDAARYAGLAGSTSDLQDKAKTVVAALVSAAKRMRPEA